MALETTDILAVQKPAAGPGSVRRAFVSDFIDLVSVSVSTIWSRTGSDISPTNDGDNLTGVGDIQAATATFTGAIEADSIDGGFKELSPGEIDYPD